MGLDRIRGMLLSGLALSALHTAVPAFAQEQAEVVRQQHEEIIVTARKRQESVLKVPVIQTVLPATELQRIQAVNLNSIAGQVPGLLIGAGTLAIGNQVSIRGVGTTSLDAGVDQSVVLNIDGLQMSQGLAYKVGMFDLAQVEVLKGPQALFFGKNSPGGVISLRSADPGADLEIIGRFGYEMEANQRRAEVILSGPVTDTLGVRLAGMYDVQDGFFRNRALAVPGLGGQTPDNRFAGAEGHILRGTVVWKPSATFDARLKVNYAQDKLDDGGIQQLVSCPDGVGAPAGFGIPFLNPADDCKLNRDMWVVDSDPAAFANIRNNGVSFSEQTQYFGTLELNYHPISELTVTSVTGYYDVVQDSMINGTAAGASASTLNADNHFSRKDFTQELRLNSDFSGPINFTAGGFYQDGQISNRISVFGNQALGIPAQLQLGRHRVDIESWSVFGQLRWKPVTNLEIAGGVRYTDEKRQHVQTNLITGTPTASDLVTPKIGAANFSPELTLTYTPTDDLTLFGSVKRGFKSGSFSVTTIAPEGSDNSFGDEQVEGGEIGLKSRWFDRQLSINLAGYYYFYKGLQVGANVLPEETGGGNTGAIILRTLNAGAAPIYGVDFDVSYRPYAVEGLNVRGSVNWNHARFRRLENVPCWGGQTIANGCDQGLDTNTGFYTSQNLNGAPLVRAPDWQMSAGIDYDFDLGGNRVKLSTNGQYSSKYLTNLLARDDFYQRAYVKFGASVAVVDGRDGWEVALIGNNLGNKIVSSNCTNGNFANGQILGGQVTGGTGVGPAGTDELLCFAERGREVWLRLTIKPANLFRR